MKIIYLFEDHVDTTNTKIKWMFEKYDEMSKERGEEFQSMCDIDIEIIEFVDNSFEEFDDFSFDID